jgi:hypothetical protein
MNDVRSHDDRDALAPQPHRNPAQSAEDSVRAWRDPRVPVPIEVLGSGPERPIRGFLPTGGQRRRERQLAVRRLHLEGDLAA